MARRRKKTNYFIYILAVAVFLFVLNYSGVLGGLNLNAFRLSLNGVNVKSDSVVALHIGVKNELALSRPFGLKKDDVFSVKIIPNAQLNFEYIVVDEYWEFTDINDYKKAFQFEYGENCFYMTIDNNTTMKSILEKIHGKEVFLFDDYDLFDESYFYVEVVSGEEVFRLGMMFEYYITLDKKGIIF